MLGIEPRQSDGERDDFERLMREGRQAAARFDYAAAAQGARAERARYIGDKLALFLGEIRRRLSLVRLPAARASEQLVRPWEP